MSVGLESSLAKSLRDKATPAFDSKTFALNVQTLTKVCWSFLSDSRHRSRSRWKALPVISVQNHGVGISALFYWWHVMICQSLFTFRRVTMLVAWFLRPQIIYLTRLSCAISEWEFQHCSIDDMLWSSSISCLNAKSCSSKSLAGTLNRDISVWYCYSTTYSLSFWKSYIKSWNFNGLCSSLFVIPKKSS